MDPLHNWNMNTTMNEITNIEIKSVADRAMIPELVAYAGSVVSLGALAIGFYSNWEDITKNQKTATFSLLAIALFVTGLIASDTAAIRRRLSGYLYTLAAASSGVAVYVTFTEDSATLQAFALAAVVALLGYTVSPTLVGHLALFVSAGGTLVALADQTVDSVDLRRYTQLSLVIAFAIGWLVLANLQTVSMSFGYLLASVALLASSQYAFNQKYENLSYAIGVGFVLLAIWLYSQTPSLVLIGAALVTMALSLTEWVISGMENSMIAIVAMLVIGTLMTFISATAVRARRQ